MKDIKPTISSNTQPFGEKVKLNSASKKKIKRKFNDRVQYRRSREIENACLMEEQ